MNNLSPVPGDKQVLSQTRQVKPSDQVSKGGPRILQWWYQITSPPEPGASASFQERELFRRGRTGSQISIILFLLLFISFPAAFAGSNSLLIGILAINPFILIAGLALNRWKRVNIAGVMFVVSIMASPIVNIVTTPGGINTSALPVFGLLVLPLMCAASFLPPASVFVVAAVNCLFTLFVLRFLPSSGELHQVLSVALPGIVTPIILSQVIVSVVAFLWVRGAKQAILRADRAEEIAELEQREIEQQQILLQQKLQLEQDIQLILQTHVEVANGNYSARAPLGKENVLWRIGYSLNNLLARLQSFNQMQGRYQHLQEENYRLNAVVQNSSSIQNELQRTREAAGRLVEMLRRSKNGHIPVVPLRSGTIIDGIAAELNNPTGSLGKKQDAP